jgi:hypothetical protein
LAFRERLLDATILARVEGQDGDTPAGLEAGWQLAEQGLQNTEFIVHFDPECLKESSDSGIAFRLVPRPFAPSIEFVEQSGELPGSGNRL